MSISLSLTPDAGGCYLLQTTLSQPIPDPEGRVISMLASEIPPDRLFPVGDAGGAGMLVPARYEGDELVATYAPGESIDLPAAIDAFGQQLNGQRPAQPYLFSPNTRRFLTQDGNLIGWQTIMLTAPALAYGITPFSLSMGDDGSNPQFSDYSGAMSGFWDYFPAPVGNFFQSDASWWAKAGVLSVGVIAGLMLAKFAAAATGIAVISKALATLGFAIGSIGGTVIASSLGAVSQDGANGWKAYATGQAMPEGVAGKIGYSAAVMAKSAERINRMVVDAGRGAIQAKQELFAYLEKVNNDLNAKINSFGSILSGWLPWLLGGLAVGGAFLGYQAWKGRR